MSETPPKEIQRVAAAFIEYYGRLNAEDPPPAFVSSENVPTMIFRGGEEVDPETGQIYYGYMYLAISADQKAIQEITERLTPPDAQARPH